MTFPEPTSKVVTVSFFFGISGYTLSSSGAVTVYDAGFDITLSKTTGVPAQREHRGTLESPLGFSTFRPDVDRSVLKTSQSKLPICTGRRSAFSHTIFRQLVV